MKVIIQLRSSGAAHQTATRGIAAPSVTSGLESAVSGISIDPQYPPVQLPGVQTTTGAGVSLIFKSAEDKTGTGFDFDYGWGILDPGALLAALP